MSKISFKPADTGSATFTLEAPATNTNRTLTLPDEAGAVLTNASDLAGVVGAGKILQIVRATDTIQRITTSTSFVDASISVTIAPQKSDSVVIIIWSRQQLNNDGSDGLFSQITDANNNPISGAEQSVFGNVGSGVRIVATENFIGFDLPNTTDAKTYKGRFKSEQGGQQLIRNQLNTGQMYAIEVAA